MQPIKSRTIVNAVVRSKVGLLLSFALCMGCLAEKKAQKASPDELMANAKQALNRDDADSAIAWLEELIAVEPKNREALFMLSHIFEMKGQLALQRDDSTAATEPLLKSAKYMKQLRTAFPDLTPLEKNELSFILYHEACALARNGQTNEAMAALEDACNLGYADVGKLKNDKSLDRVRSLPRFKTLLESVTGKTLAKAREQAREWIAAQKPFAFNFSLPDLDGKTVALKDFAGKILIADFWGTWCPPCRMGIPHFVELVKNYEGQGLRVVGITYERVKPDKVVKTIREFAKANDMNYPSLIGDEKTSAQIPDFGALPTTLFIDRAGKVRLCVVGYHSETELEAIVQELLEDKTALRK